MLLRLLVTVAVLAPAGYACDFRYDPITAPQYYRSGGWRLPGVDDFDSSAPFDSYGLPITPSVPGAVAEVFEHRDPYIVQFPAQEFDLNGTRERMRSVQAKVKILRWRVHGRIVAYSYSLIPVAAHQDEGKWVIESEMACIFFATFIDDRGDGIFRVLVPDSFSQDLVPGWARKERN